MVEVADAFAVQDEFFGAGGAFGDHVVGGAGGEALQGEDDSTLDVVVDGVELVDGDAEGFGEFGLGGGAAEGGGELLVGGFDAAGAGAYGAAGPVEAAELVEEGAADAGGGEGSEGGAAGGVVVFGGHGEGGHAGGDEVFAGDVGG